MVRRIVLGCGLIGHAVVEALNSRPGELLVIDQSDTRVETLRNEGIAAEERSPVDVASIVDEADVVLVADDDPEMNRDAAVAARDAFPDCYLVVYTGVDGDDSLRESIAQVADSVLDPGRIVSSVIREHVTSGVGTKLQRFKRFLRGIDGPLAVFTHDDPDPDAIASAIALVSIARSLGVEADAYYVGEIAHQENRALVNLLDLTLTNVDPTTFDPAEFGAIALVDHSRPDVNDSLPPDTPIDIVIDHHPPRGPIDADFVDIQSDVGATSTLLVDYFRGLDREPDPTVATALLYGIRVDTRNFGREITVADFEAAAFLLPYARSEVLERVESPSVSGDTLDTISRAIHNYRREGSTVVSGVGSVGNRDAISQAADQLLVMEGITVTVVYGFIEDTVYLSGRSRGGDLDIGETMRQAFDQIGSAGGHSDMAGAQLPFGILGSVEDENDSLEDVVGQVIVDRFFEVVGNRASAPAVDFVIDPGDDDLTVD